MERSQRFSDYGPGGRVRLAHAYVPFQRYENHYQPAEALNRGTLFPELYMPYRQGSMKGSY
ncbi:MAG: spore coat associated protein CotJA [Halanaerobiaceae bacterium]